MVLALFLSLAFQAPPPSDSLSAVRAARAAQADFERTRRHHSPITHGSSGGSCDERIGRYCYWYNESEADPPPEPERIVAARRVLLDRLGELAQAVPGDGWIAGQRVRYLVEHGEPDSALAASRHCLAEAWWCTALAGFSLHAGQRYAESDSVFAFALAVMPEPVRCEWTDLDPLLEAEARKAYRGLSCAERDSANAEILWLARPRFAVPGNDLRTELFARQTYFAALEDARTPFDLGATDDLRELILRYGWATAWSQRPDGGWSSQPASIIGHERSPAYPLLPEQLGAPDHWAKRLSRDRPRARYAPVWTPAIVPVREVLVSRFERAAGGGDSVLVVAAFAVRADTLFQGDSVVARLALSSAPSGRPVVVEAEAPEGRGSISVTAPSSEGLASLEITDESTGALALHRTRLVDSTGGPRLSDLLLFEPGPSLPNSAEAAVPHALASARVAKGARLGLYWEVYGLPDGLDSVGVSVAVETEGPGRVTRTGRAKAGPPLRLGWRAGEQRGQAIEVDLRLLDPGRYRIRIRVDVGEYGPIEASRQIEITRR